MYPFSHTGIMPQTKKAALRVNPWAALVLSYGDRSTVRRTRSLRTLMAGAGRLTGCFSREHAFGCAGGKRDCQGPLFGLCISCIDPLCIDPRQYREEPVGGTYGKDV